MKASTVVGIGEILWDVFPERKILGGAPANFAYHISQLGYNGFAVSAIGNDTLGKEIIAQLEEKKLNYLIESVDFPTGTVNVTLDSDGIPYYEIKENVAWDNIPFTETTQNLAVQTQTVCFGSLAQRNTVSRKMIRRFLDAMPKESLKIFDINLRQHYYSKAIIHDSLESANVLKINDEEIISVTQLYEWNENEQTVCKRLIDLYHLDMVILTKGIDGSCVITDNEFSFLDTPNVDVIDTVGAGDSFTAAFVAAFLCYGDIPAAHRLAVEVSAFVCTQHGAMPKLPDTFLEFRK